MNRILKIPVALGMLGIMLIIIAGLTGCLKMSTEDEINARKIVSGYSKSFKKQAKIQYGENASVYNISAETTTEYGSVWPTVKIKTTGNLDGIVKADGEEFRCKYDVQSNEIYSQKNYKIINESLKAYFDYLNLNIIDSTITDPAYQNYYLPADITSFEEMLKSNYFMLATIYVTDDLGQIPQDSFENLEGHWKKYSSYVGSIVFIQVDDISSANEIKNIVKDIDFSSDERNVYDNASHGYIDSFDKYNINSSIYISYSNNKLKYHYNNR